MNKISNQNRKEENRKKTRYLVIGYSRSGTTVTHLALMGHPNVCALNDELRPTPFFTKGISSFTHGNDLEDENTSGYSAIFDAITLIRENENTMAHGAKTACNSLKSARAVTEVIRNHLRDLKVILIYRSDIIAQYGSGKVGKKYGIMHSWYKGLENRKVDKIKINKWRFIAYANGVSNMYEALSELKESNDVLEVFYEDLLEDSGSFFSRIFQFLELPDIQPSWLASKKVLPPPESYIRNYPALQAELDRIKSGNLPSHVLFFAKVVNQFFRRMENFFSRKIK